MKENKLFAKAADNDEAKLRVIFDNLSTEDKQNIFEANLSTIYDTNSIEGKMKFINQLPFAYK